MNGVRFYGSALAQSDVVAAITATKPTVAPPKFPDQVTLYKGPVLLGFDPRFNSYDVTPPMLSAASCKYTPVPITGHMPPKVQLSFTGETPDTRSVVMSDYGSVGLTGRPFDIWMQMDLGGGGTGGGGVGGGGAGGGAAGYSVQGFDAPFSKEYVFLLLCLFLPP